MLQQRAARIPRRNGTGEKPSPPLVRKDSYTSAEAILIADQLGEMPQPGSDDEEALCTRIRLLPKVSNLDHFIVESNNRQA